MTLAEHMPPQHVTPADSADSWPVRLMPGPRWFSENDPVYRLHADPSTTVGELAGVLLESLHLGCAGFLREIGCADDVWHAVGRVHEYDQVVVHGTIDDAMVTISRRHELRLGVHGRDERGAYFWGGDRELTKWTLQARMWAMLAANREFSPEPLDNAEADVAVANWARIARLAGVSDPAESFGELNSYLRRQAATLARTEVTERFLEQLVGSGAARPAGESDRALGHAALSVLPPRVRRLLGLSPDSRAQLGSAPLSPRMGSGGSAPGDVPAPIAPPSALLLTLQFR